MSKRALICGVSGQDGAYLARLLLERGYEVWGSSRDAELKSFTNLRTLGIEKSITLVSLNLTDFGGILKLLRRVQPHEVFNLSGQSSVGLSFEQPMETMESIALATLNLLEAIRLSDSNIRFYNAGSTECFGDTGDGRATETSSFHPRSPYAVAKVSAHLLVANYREAYGMYACTGVLSNHDSSLRPRRFVTRKIIHAVAKLTVDQHQRLALGNLSIERDWGWAPDYVEAIASLLQQAVPDDYIIATGESFTLTDFVATAFRLIGKDWRDHVDIEEGLLRPTDIARSNVDPTKAREELGWTATCKMPEVIAKMLDEEIAQLSGDSWL